MEGIFKCYWTKDWDVWAGNAGGSGGGVSVVAVESACSGAAVQQAHFRWAAPSGNVRDGVWWKRVVLLE